MTAAPDLLTTAAAERPDAVAVIVDPWGGAIASTTTNAELEALTNRFANGLLAHAAPGERLVWCGPNSREVLVAMKEAGLTSLPGGGAEVFSTAVRASSRTSSGASQTKIPRARPRIGSEYSSCAATSPCSFRSTSMLL